jgi:biopolymer transport protein ExbB/TolQ
VDFDSCRNGSADHLGWFGTVWGIMLTFHTMGAAPASAPTSVIPI